MKKFFLFAAAAVAALSVNAKVISFAGVVDKTSAETAKSSFEAAYDLKNITVAGKANSDNTAFYAEVTQTAATDAWGNTPAKLKADAQAYFDFKDNKADKVVAKAWADYFQPNGKAVCLVITGLTPGSEVTINLKDALNKEVAIEGASVATDKFASASVKLTAMQSEIRVYSKNAAGDADAKWKLVSVEIAGDQAIENVEAEVKSVKTFENGQLVIIKNGVKYNALGAQL